MSTGPTLTETAIDLERAKRHAKRTVDAEERPPRPPLRALTVAELYARPDPEYLVDQLLPRGALAEFVGDSETLKSFFAIALGMAIAAKQAKFFGLDVMTHGAVLYIAAEGQGAFKHRLRAWGTAHGVDTTTVPFRIVASPVNLRDETFQQELRTLVSEIQPVLIIVDTLHRCLPGAEENSSRDLGEVVGFATRLLDEFGATVWFLHHPPKSDPSGRGRGSSVLYYAADTELNAVLEGAEKADGTKVIIVAVKKQKDDAKVSLTLKNLIVPVLNEQGRPMAHPKNGRAINSCILVVASADEVNAAKNGPADTLAHRVVEFLLAHPRNTKVEIREGVKARVSSLNDAIDGLLADKRITKEHAKRGRVWADEYQVGKSDS